MRLLSKEEVLSHVELLISDVEIAVHLAIFKITIQLQLIILRTATQKLQLSSDFTLKTR